MPGQATTKPAGASAIGLEEVVAALRCLREDVLRALPQAGSGSDDPSVANMRAYLALRSRDNRALQASLARLGLSSLGRSEGHVLATLDRVLAIAEGLEADGARSPARPFDEAAELLLRRADALFGPRRGHRDTRIMVTLPTDAAKDAGLVSSLVAAGMDCARINSAHDDEAAWAEMASYVRAASGGGGRRVPILVDLPGPKLRTGPVAPGPEVIRLRPRRTGSRRGCRGCGSARRLRMAGGALA